MLAAAVLGGAGAYPALLAPVLSRLLLPLAAASAALVLVASYKRWATLMQVALLLVVAGYAGSLAVRGEVDSRAPLFAAVLLVGAELAYASLEPPTTRRALARSALLVGAAAIGAVAVGVFLVGTAGVGRGTLVEYGVGVGAAAAAVGVLAWLAWLARVRV